MFFSQNFLRLVFNGLKLFMIQKTVYVAKGVLVFYFSGSVFREINIEKYI